MIDFTNILSSDYQNFDYFKNEVLVKIFGNFDDSTAEDDYIRDNESLRKAAEAANIKAIRKTGEINTLESPLEVFEIIINSKSKISLSRVGIQNVVRRQLQKMGNAFMVFRYENPENRSWRFSFLQKGESQKDSTSAKRYTYVFGRDYNPRTANERFNKLCGKIDEDGDCLVSDDDLEEAFSVEALTKEFYNKIYDWFLRATDRDKGLAYFPNMTNTEKDDFVHLEIHIIRFLTRIMFVWFIKQNQLVDEKLFDADELKDVLKDFDPLDDKSSQYYNAILQNLFFATLNCEIKGREFAEKVGSRDSKNLYRYDELFNIGKDQIKQLFASIPFLNGGLFECLDKDTQMDGVKLNIDGFSRNDSKRSGRYTNRAFIANNLFFEKDNGLFDIFRQYNFTVEENTPLEQTVALDPELLGKIFENLLGAFNPETQETARKDSGSFYTPREVVGYMVDQSIRQYLINQGIEEGVADRIFKDDFEPYIAVDKTENGALQKMEINLLLAQDYAKIVEKLKAIKILDPACGSGAFPMGILNRIADIIAKLSPDDAKDIHALKLHIIENCIYGSDIQQIAVQICKLRFFISLICDVKKDETKDNFGISPLPNLETKFVCADSLIGLKNPKKQPVQQNLFIDTQIYSTRKQLLEIRHRHFNAKKANDKKILRQQDEKLRKELVSLLSQGFKSGFDADELASWNPYDQNSSAKFFDPDFMFNISDGFDIIIGNPPYIQLQNNGGKLAKEYENCKYESFAKTGDIYCLFYERAHQLLKEGGLCCFITSNKWMRAGYGEALRTFFASKTNPLLLIDFAGVKVFDSATVDTNILIYAKHAPQNQTLACSAKTLSKQDLKNLAAFVKNNTVQCNFPAGDSWVILSPIEQSIKRKIESVGTPLKDWDIQINYGIKTGFNDAFIITTEKKDEILAACATAEERQKTAEIIRPILRGRDIKRYGYDWAGLWLIATFPSKKYNIEKLPAIKNHLLSFGKERLEQTGKTYHINGETIKARKKTNNKWFETQDSISYWDDFNKPKIVYPNMTKFLPFVYDEKQFVTNQKCFIITGRFTAFLTAFFNSSLFKYCFRDSFPELQGGTRELSKIFFDKIPVIKVDKETDSKFKALVDEIQREYTREKAINIDNIIFDMYGLNEEEKRIIGFVEIK